MCDSNSQVQIPDQSSIYFINEYVIHGYKQLGMTSKECVQSIFQVNNESMNVLTSALNIIITIAWVWYIWRLAKNNKRKASPIPPLFFVLLVVAGVCHIITWLGSLLAHACTTHKSHELVDKLWRFDMASIYLTVLGFSNLGMLVEMAPYASLETLLAGMCIGSLTCIVAMIFMLKKEGIHDENNRALRALPWLITVGVYWLPVILKNVCHGMGASSPWFVLAIVWYLIGGFFHVSKAPECLTENKTIQKWCLSHHWWHWANILGDACFFYAVLIYATST